MQAPSLTLGVEEEYQIIDPKTRELTSYITQILEADHRFLEQVKPVLESADPARARLLRTALQQLEILQQERLMLTMPLIDVR